MPNPLSFNSLPQKSASSLKIQIKDPYFTNCTKLLSNDHFPKIELGKIHIQCEIHRNDIILVQKNHRSKVNASQKTKSNNFEQNEEGKVQSCYESYRVKQGQKLMNQFLNNVRWIVVRNRSITHDQLEVQMIRLLDFTSCLGFRIVKVQKDNFKRGDIVIYYLTQNQKQIQVLKQDIKAFSSILIHFPLTQFIQKWKLPQNLLIQCLNELIHFHHQEIQSVATRHYLFISNMVLTRRSQDFAEKQYCLGICVSGLMNCLHEFYNSLQYTFNSFVVKTVDIRQLRGVKLQELGQSYLTYGQGCRMINAQVIGNFGRQTDWGRWKEMMYGMWIVNDKFSQEEQKVLRLELNKQRFKDYINKQPVQFRSLSSTKHGYLILVCTLNDLEPIIKILHKYCSKFTIQTQSCPQLQHPPLLAPIFLKHYIKCVQQKYSIQLAYNPQHNTIIRTNFTIDSVQIIEQIKNIKMQILKQFVYVPSLTNISKYLANQEGFNGMFKVEKNGKGFWDVSWREVRYRVGRMKIMLTEFANLVHFQDNLVCLMHNDIPNYSQIYKIAHENNIEMKQFISGCTSQKPSRVRRYPLNQSTRLGSVTMMYFQIKQPIIKHQDEDIRDFLKQNQKQDRINILIGVNSKKFIDEILSKFLIMINQFVNGTKDARDRNFKAQTKIREVWLYYEESSSLSSIERVIINSKLQAVVVARDIFDNWALLRMNNLKQYVLSYYWNKGTYYLPGLDSYIFHHQRSKSSKSRALLSLPTPYQIQIGYHQFYIDFRLQQIHQILSFSQIQILTYKEVSKQFQILIKIIEKEFNHLDFFVAYAKNNQYDIGSQVCTEIYYCNDQNVNCVIPLSFDLEGRKVGIRGGVDKVYIAVVEKKYVDWYRICTHAKQLDNVQKCLEK